MKAGTITIFTHLDIFHFVRVYLWVSIPFCLDNLFLFTAWLKGIFSFSLEVTEHRCV